MVGQIQLYKGSWFDFDDLDSNEIEMEDIAHSLSNQCRWSGHTIFHYSVAQHSCYAHDWAYKLYGKNAHEIAWEALMHDSPESVFVDFPRPLKKMIPDYGIKLDVIETWFSGKFKYPHPMTENVSILDDRMLITEYRQVVDINRKTNHPTFVSFYTKPFDNFFIKKWTPYQAKKAFLKRYEKLKEHLDI